MNNVEMLYQLQNIDHGYDEFRLKVDDFVINRGISMGLSGPNGSGKSTLLKLLAFLEEPDRGKVNFYESKIYSKSVTLLHQDPYLLKRSVFENISYGLKIRGDSKDIKKRVYDSLERVNLNPEQFAYRWWTELSGGEVQRVALASRIILKPAVLLLDEPVSNVDSESAVAISGAINQMRRDFATTIIISSHDLLWLSSVTDEIWKLHNGRITGTDNVNIIQGPWKKETDNVWFSQFSSDIKIYATQPPEENSIAMLYPYDIIISQNDVEDISALNRIEAIVKLMAVEESRGRIRIEADVSGKILTVYITEKSAQEMSIFPGRKIFLIFKATALMW